MWCDPCGSPGGSPSGSFGGLRLEEMQDARRMKPFPVLHTDRLTLREFVAEDASDVRGILDDEEFARTLFVPHPYEEGTAEEFVADARTDFESGESVDFAVTLRLDGALIGCVSLRPNVQHDNAELVYWLGRSHWGRGYATEAAREVLGYAFEVLGFHRVHATHLGNNPASGRVMQKAGMSYEGTFREHRKRWGEYKDSVFYGLLARDWGTLE